MNDAQFNYECMKYRGFDHYYYPTELKREATIADVIDLAHNDGRRSSNEFDTDEIEYCWRQWRCKFKPALLHFIKRHGIQATIKVIRAWRKSFLRDTEKGVTNEYPYRF
tara:strand:+ start:1087 stop:1413 length:327 start_codon:yes stop_codon:yes gene_type:complete